MRFLKLVLAAFLLLMPGYAVAQSASTFRVYASCATATYNVGDQQYGTMDTTGDLCTNAGAASGDATIIAPLGSKVSASGVSVTIASDQAAVAVKQTTAANLNATVVGTGTFADQSTLQAGSAIVGKFGIDQTTPGTSNAVQGVPGTSNGLLMSSVISLATTNTNLVSTAAAHNLYYIGLFNNSTAIGYLKLYDTATAPTCGSGTPVKRIMIPGNTNGAGVVLTMPSGLSFASGIGFCLTGAIGDSDTTAVAANQFIVNLDFK